MSFPPALQFILTLLIAASTLDNCLQAGHFEINSAVELIGYAGSKVFFRDATNTTTTLGGYIKFCNNNSMTAASVENVSETKVITNYITSTNYTPHFWLGGWDATFSGNFTWFNSCRQFNHTDWSPGSGNPYPRGQRGCTFISTNAAYIGTCYDDTCERTAVPLCQLLVG